MCNIPYFLLRLSLIGTAALSLFLGTPRTASAQPIITPFTSAVTTSLRVDDVTNPTYQDADLLTYSNSVNGSGHLSNPFGAMWDLFYQDCTGSATASGSVEGPGPPFISTNASSSGTQNGTVNISQTATLADSVASLNWQFGFWSPTFGGLTGGEDILIAFNLSGEASTSGVCVDPGFCGSVSTARIELGQFNSNVLVVAQALETGPTVAPMNSDQVTAPSVSWDVRLSASSREGGFATTLGATGSGSSVADINNIQLVVDFALTESLIQAANPTLSQTIIDQGLADLELHVSPGVELPSFAPQFPQSAPPTPAPILGFLGQIALALSLTIGGGLFLTAKRV